MQQSDDYALHSLISYNDFEKPVKQYVQRTNETCELNPVNERV
jgi:hypothetical protein